MIPNRIRIWINEYIGANPNAAKDEIDCLETALYIEDVFGIELSDAEICKKNLATPHEIEKFVIRKLEWKNGCAGSVE